MKQHVWAVWWQVCRNTAGKGAQSRLGQSCTVREHDLPVVQTGHIKARAPVRNDNKSMIFGNAQFAQVK